MTDVELTLEELSERTGVEARTLRSWVSEGLLAAPFKPGRGARYPASNADRALAVRALKDLHGLSLSEIGRRFMMATEDQIREWALAAGPTTAPSGSARDYLRRIQAWSAAEEPPQRSFGFVKKKPPSSASERPSHEPRFSKQPMLTYREPRSDERQAELANIERLILQLEKVLEAPAPRRSRGAVWMRISVTPDLELSVRGDLEPRERVLFEQLADQFRAILTGRAKND
jgi:DNA-binding transcriptional MerR regulator